MIWDHNRGLMYQRVQAAYDDQEASQYIWGTAFHWYTGDHFDNVRIVHDAFPDKHLLYTEGGIGGTWPAAQRLAKNIILDLNNWTEGWAVWNLMSTRRTARATPAASERGGSTIVNADTTTGKITYNPPHYVLRPVLPLHPPRRQAHRLHLQQRQLHRHGRAQPRRHRRRRRLQPYGPRHLPPRLAHAGSSSNTSVRLTARLPSFFNPYRRSYLCQESLHFCWW